MEQIAGQLSIFDLLMEDELPEEVRPAPRLIAPEDFHVGVKGWMIHAVVYEHGRFAGMMIVYTDMWKSVEEPKQDNKGRWSTAGEKVRRKGEYHAGWYGGTRTLYRQTPTFDERTEFAHQSREYVPGVRIVDADCIVALEGPPLSEDEKDFLRRWHR